MTVIISHFLLLSGMLLYSAGSLAQSDSPVMQKAGSGLSMSDPVAHDMCAPNGVAMAGLDLVSYRQESGPVSGLAKFSATHLGLTYLFIDETNLTLFRQQPENYLPEYSGFCAVTLALGRVTCPQYRNFKIEGDRLLLFEVTGFTNGRTLWNSDPTEYRKKADNNFAKISG